MKLPLVKISIFFILGITIGCFFPVSNSILLSILIALFFGLLFLNNLVKNYQSKKIVSSFFLLLIIVIGFTRSAAFNQLQKVTHFSKTESKYLVGVVESSIEEKENSYKTILKIIQSNDSISTKNTTGNLLCYIEKDTIFSNLQIGDIIAIPAIYNIVEAPKNPVQFNYKKYLSWKNIYHQIYLKKENIIFVEKNTSNFILKKYADKTSIFFQKILKKYIIGTENFALADGILLGHRANIDMDLYNAFAYTGTLHILSVSGLHVGVIYGLLLFILSFIPNKNKQIKIAKFIFSTLFIWAFAFITGFSAAVVRAAILFTLLNYGQLQKENTNSINLLCGSAIIQLLINPYQIFDIGFQLSYLAMLGLFLFYKKTHTSIYISNKWIDKIWEIWAASLAAQILTLPLSLYYFGSFPTYFLIANIFAIPLSTLILWTSIALLTFNFVPILNIFLGKLVSLQTALFVWFTKIITQLPLGILNTIYINNIQLFLLFILVILFSFWFLQKQFQLLKYILMLVIIVVSISLYDNFKLKNKSEILFFNTKNTTLIGYKNGKNQFLIGDSLAQKNIDFIVKNYNRKNKILKQNFIDIESTIYQKNIYLSNNLLQINNKTIFILDKKTQNIQLQKPLKIDFILIRNNPFLNLENLQSNFIFSKIIIDNSNNYYHQKTYTKLLEAQKISFINLKEKYYVIDL